MHSPRDQQQIPEPGSQEWMRQQLAHRLSQSQTIWSEMVQFVTNNTPSLHLVTLFITFLVLQSVHIRNDNHLKRELTTFLVENEALDPANDQMDQVNHFMAQFGKAFVYTLPLCNF